LQESKLLRLIITVPETHADAMREAIGQAKAGIIGEYSHCSFSVKGIGRFLPSEKSCPHIGAQGVLEEVIEERIETVCHRKDAPEVLAKIKQAHPYEETIIDIYPIYEIGRKRPCY